jgi:hypothetical protein
MLDGAVGIDMLREKCPLCAEEVTDPLCCTLHKAPYTKILLPFSSVGRSVYYTQAYVYVGLTTGSSVFVLGTTANLCCISNQRYF